ncbi:MAG TPA: hypothetical protein VK919_08855 [Solirubrobacterales bacterium]|nr:hypothetical protein [Solirubrobacterales bacterium]
MKRLITIAALAAALAAPATASAAHDQGRHDCFGAAVAAEGGPGFGGLVSSIAREHRPLGRIVSFEARTCEEVFED